MDEGREGGWGVGVGVWRGVEGGRRGWDGDGGGGGGGGGVDALKPSGVQKGREAIERQSLH